MEHDPLTRPALGDRHPQRLATSGASATGPIAHPTILLGAVQHAGEVQHPLTCLELLQIQHHNWFGASGWKSRLTRSARLSPLDAEHTITTSSRHFRRTLPITSLRINHSIPSYSPHALLHARYTHTHIPLSQLHTQSPHTPLSHHPRTHHPPTLIALAKPQHPHIIHLIFTYSPHNQTTTILFLLTKTTTFFNLPLLSNPFLTHNTSTPLSPLLHTLYPPSSTTSTSTNSTTSTTTPTLNTSTNTTPNNQPPSPQTPPTTHPHTPHPPPPAELTVSDSQPFKHLEHRAQLGRGDPRAVPVLGERAAWTHELP